LDNTQILHQKQQLDIANQLMSEHNYQQAADAYEKLLSKYPKSQQIEQIQLLLGVIYSRYLKNPKRAKNLFDEAKRLLKDPVQLQLCENELANLNLQN
jgi:outer membrane protein assembly factor BamD (BamD/ComL family)